MDSWPWLDWCVHWPLYYNLQTRVTGARLLSARVSVKLRLDPTDINSNSEEEPSPSKKLKTNNINETKNVNNSKHEIEQNLVQVGEKFKCNSCGYYYNQSYDDMTTHMCDDFTKVKKLAIEVITSKDNNDFPKFKNDQTEKMKKNTTGMVKCKICDRRINLQFIKSHSKNMHGKFSVDMYEGEIPKSLTESCINLLANKKQEESPSPSK